MPGTRRRRNQATGSTENDEAAQSTDVKTRTLDASLPLARQASIVGTQALFLGFTALYLPRSTVRLMGEGFLPPPSSSLDRPQHPFLNPLTANPTATMLWLCAGVGVTISWSAGYLRVWFLQADQKAIGSEAEARELVKASPKRKAILESWFAVSLAIPVVTALLFLFGAPLGPHAGETLLFAWLLSVLTVYSPVYALNRSESSSFSHYQTFVRLFSEMHLRTHAERALVYPAIGSVVTAWAGAFVFPLDWDRPWQAWPLVPAYMAILGHVIGSFASVIVSSVLVLAQAGRDQK